MPGQRRAFFLDEPLAAADCTTDRLETETAVATRPVWVALYIPTLDYFAGALANLAGSATHPPASVAPSLDWLVLLRSWLVLPHLLFPTPDFRPLMCDHRWVMTAHALCFVTYSKGLLPNSQRDCGKR